MLRAGELANDDGNALLELAGLNKSFTYSKDHGITALDGVDDTARTELAKLSA